MNKSNSNFKKVGLWTVASIFLLIGTFDLLVNKMTLAFSTSDTVTAKIIGVSIPLIWLAIGAGFARWAYKADS